MIKVQNTDVKGASNIYDTPTSNIPITNEQYVKMSAVDPRPKLPERPLVNGHAPRPKESIENGSGLNIQAELDDIADTNYQDALSVNTSSAQSVLSDRDVNLLLDDIHNED